MTAIIVAKFHSENLAKMLRSTSNKNSNCGIVALATDRGSITDPSAYDLIEDEQIGEERLCEIFEMMCNWAPPPPPSKSLLQQAVAMETPERTSSAKLQKTATV